VNDEKHIRELLQSYGTLGTGGNDSLVQLARAARDIIESDRYIIAQLQREHSQLLEQFDEEKRRREEIIAARVHQELMKRCWELKGALRSEEAHFKLRLEMVMEECIPLGK
jgi:hypothetical protein